MNLQACMYAQMHINAPKWMYKLTHCSSLCHFSSQGAQKCVSNLISITQLSQLPFFGESSGLPTGKFERSLQNIEKDLPESGSMISASLDDDWVNCGGEDTAPHPITRSPPDTTASISTPPVMPAPLTTCWHSWHAWVTHHRRDRMKWTRLIGPWKCISKILW